MFSFKCTHCKISRRVTNTEEDGGGKKSLPVRVSSNYLCFVSFSTQLIMERLGEKNKDERTQQVALYILLQILGLQ